MIVKNTIQSYEKAVFVDRRCRSGPPSTPCTARASYSRSRACPRSWCLNSPACAAGAANETTSVHSAAADAVITFEIISVLLLLNQDDFFKWPPVISELGTPIHFDNMDKRNRRFGFSPFRASLARDAPQRVERHAAGRLPLLSKPSPEPGAASRLSRLRQKMAEAADEPAGWAAACLLRPVKHQRANFDAFTPRRVGRRGRIDKGGVRSEARAAVGG